MPANSNKALIQLVAIALGELRHQMVFVGGAVTELYVSPGMDILEVRPTNDVDCVIQILNYRHLATLEEELRSKGFVNDPKLIIRWHYAGIIVDIMPDDPAIVGFSNRWYAPGIASSIHYDLGSNLPIRIFTLPYYLATKLEALADRGMSDIRLSKDFEDIVFCLFYRADIAQIITQAPTEVKHYICQSIQQLLQHPNIDEAIYATLPGGEVLMENVAKVKAAMKSVVD